MRSQALASVLLASAAAQAGKKHCPPSCKGACTADDGPCAWLYDVPGAELLGHAVHPHLFAKIAVNPLEDHVLAEAVKTEAQSWFVDEPDYVDGLWDRQIKGKTIHYVVPNSTNIPTVLKDSGGTAALSTSTFAHASAKSFDAGFKKKGGWVAVSASMAKGSSHSDYIHQFAGTARLYDWDYKISLKGSATFNPNLIEDVGHYDGSGEQRDKFTGLFDKLGLYFVEEVTVGGFFEYKTTVQTTHETDSSQYAFDFKVRVAFVSGGSGGGHSDQDDVFHHNVATSTHCIGGDDGFRPILQSYEQIINNETIDTSNWQKDYANWAGSIGESPVAVDMKVAHISTRFDETHSMTPEQRNAVDDLHMAYDEILNELNAKSLNILRVQYGADLVQFDKHDGQYLEFPTDLHGLPGDAQNTRGFLTEYDDTNSCNRAQLDEHNRKLGRVLRYTEMCNEDTNLLDCSAFDWCKNDDTSLLTENNIGASVDHKEWNKELFMRVTFTAGVANEIQTVDFKPCGHGAAWAVYWNEHDPYSYNRSRTAVVLGPVYNDLEGGGRSMLVSGADKALFSCAPENNMSDIPGEDPACCDTLPEDYIQSQLVGCPDNCGDQKPGCQFRPGAGNGLRCYAPTPTPPAPTPPPPPAPTPPPGDMGYIKLDNGWWFSCDDDLGCGFYTDKHDNDKYRYWDNQFHKHNSDGSDTGRCLRKDDSNVGGYSGWVKLDSCDADNTRDWRWDGDTNYIWWGLQSAMAFNGYGSFVKMGACNPCLSLRWPEDGSGLASNTSQFGHAPETFV